jgi:hypothetical protein
VRTFLVSLAAVVYGCMFSAGVVQAQTVLKLQGTDVVVNGEGVLQASNITSELTRLARADGHLPSNENFKSIAVSGATLSQIKDFYQNCNPKPTYLITDGGAIDLMDACPSPVTADCSRIKDVLNAAQQYLAKMKENGTKKVVWMRYADPQDKSWVALKANLDVAMPEIEKICRASTDPKVLWVDLRPIWAEHYSQYTSEGGFMCTSAGGTATAEAFWKVMKDSNFFDLGEVPVQPYTIIKTAPSAFLGRVVGTDRISLSLSLAQPSSISMRITTVSGRTVLTAERRGLVSGLQTVRFPLGALVSGVYCLDVQAGQMLERSVLLVR